MERVPVYIGMTTIPDRIRKGRTAKSIISLLENIVRCEKIVLTIPDRTLKGEKYPDDILERYPYNHEDVIINRIDKDEGPILKLMGLIDYMKKSGINVKNIMLADDDTVYAKNNIRHLWGLNKKFEGKSIGYAGRKWNRDRKTLVFQRYKTLIIKGIEIPFNVMDILESYHLVIHKTSLFMDKYEEWRDFVYKTMEECGDSRFTDDIIISLWCKKNNVSRIICKGPKIRVIDNNTPKLSNQNLKGRNDKVFLKLFG